MKNTPQQYRDVYREYLAFNNLSDDSFSLTDSDIFNFIVDNFDNVDLSLHGLNTIEYCKLRDEEDATNITGTQIEIKDLALPYKGSAETFRIVYNGHEYDECSTAFDFFTLHN